MAEKPTHKEINQKEMLTKASSAQWQTTFDAINDAVCLLDMNGKILRCNKAMESFLKKSSKEIIGGTCWKLVHGTDKPVKGCPIVRMKKTLCRETLVLKVDDKWLNVAVDPVIDETGNLASAVHIISDITQRKQAEETQRETKEKYRALYDNAPLSYQSLNENGCFIDVNPAWIRTLGYDRKEVIGKWFGDLLHPDWKPHFEKSFQEFKRRGYVHDVQFKMRHKDGHYLDISFEGYIGYNPDGSFKQTYCVSQDITERKQAEQSLQEAKAELKHTIKVVPGIIAKVNTHTGYFTHCNPAFSSILGFSTEEILARPFIEFVHPDDRQSTINEVEKQLKGSPLAMFENRYICKNGSYKWLEWKATAVDEKEVIYAAATDITERKQAEKELIKSEKLYKDAQSLAHIGHWDYEPYEDSLFWSDELYSIFEIDKDAGPLSIEDFLGRIHPEDRDTIREQVEKGESYRSDYRIVMDNGSAKQIHEEVQIVHQEDGKIALIKGTAQDITERKQAEEELQERMNELETFYRATLGREGRVIELKQEVNELLEQLGKNKKYRDYSLGTWTK